MQTDFLAQLKRIKQDAQERAAAAAAAQREEALTRAETEEAYFALRSRVEEAIHRAFDDFCREFEGFEKQAGFVGDDYCLSVAYDEVVMGGGRDAVVEKSLSQLTFKIKALRGSRYFVLTSKAILRNRERGQRVWDEKIQDARPEPILEFVQQEVLRFARAFSARNAADFGA